MGMSGNVMTDALMNGMVMSDGYRCCIRGRVVRLAYVPGHELTAAVMAAFLDARLDGRQLDLCLVVNDRCTPRNAIHIGPHYTRQTGELLFDPARAQDRQQAFDVKIR